MVYVARQSRQEWIKTLLTFGTQKGFDFRTVTDDEIQLVEDIINNRPRKCLDWKTPAEVFYESVALA